MFAMLRKMGASLRILDEIKREIDVQSVLVFPHCVGFFSR
jgi:hypothetical protein